jgi:hypothetical protein
MRRTLMFLSGLGLGAGLMYLLDPDSGSTRRARARDGAVQLGRRTGSLVRDKGNEVGHRLRERFTDLTHRIGRHAEPDAAEVDAAEELREPAHRSWKMMTGVGVGVGAAGLAAATAYRRRARAREDARMDGNSLMSTP